MIKFGSFIETSKIPLNKNNLIILLWTNLFTKSY